MGKRIPTTIMVLVFAVGSAQADLVAYWPMDEGSGTVTADASGNGLDATMLNPWGEDMLIWIDGQSAAFGKALLFGTDSSGGTDVWNFLSVDYKPVLDLAGNWTITAWISVDSDASANWHDYPRIISCENYSFMMGQNGDNTT